MFTKLLITVAVIAIMFWLGKRKSQPQHQQQGEPLPPSPAAMLLQRFAPLFAIVALLLACAWFGYGWYQDQQILQVTVTSSQGEQSVYQVRRGQLEGRRLITVNGLQVELSQLDRVEVKPIQ